MKIIQLAAENVKKLRAVEITPAGDLVQITGKNGAGKTSVLDAIWWALAGAKHIQAVPIRKGADKARIRLDLGELVVERRFGKSTELIVTNAEGARYPSPQGMLDALLGALTFDPLAFVGLEPLKQFEVLRGLVHLDVDLDALAEESRILYERRTQVNRDAKAVRARADAIAAPATMPDPIDVSALKDRLASAAKTNGEIETRRVRREATAADVSSRRERAEEARERAAALRREADDMETAARKLDAEADADAKKLEDAPPLPEPVDVDSLRREIDEGEAVNARRDRYNSRAALVAEADSLTKESRGLTEQIEALAKQREDAIAAAEMPVDGLGFGDGVVTFGGIPFDQASTAEQLRVSIAIAMAANPKLRVIRIKEGSLLDEDNVQLIASMAQQQDYQVWIERVDSSGKIGIVIDDGSIVSVDGERVEA